MSGTITGMIPHRDFGYETVTVGPTNCDPVVEALRALAALMVMATHYSYMLPFQSGLLGFASTGVDLFFVLSGFVFAPYFFGKRLLLLPHLIRRFFRLYPLYLFALLLYVGLRLPATTALDHFWIHLVMGHTLTSLTEANFYNPAFWSLPPEIEYYLVLPFLVWITVGNSRYRLRFAWLVLIAVAMHLALVAVAPPSEKEITARAIATIHIPGLLAEFMLGSLAYAVRQRDARGLLAAVRLVLGLLVLAGMAAVFANHVAPINGTARTVPIWIGGNIGLGAAVGYALIVSAVACPSGHLAHQCSHLAVGSVRLWSTRTLQPILIFMGELSYGVYLVHNAAPQILGRVFPTSNGWVALTSCIGITLVIALAANQTIEKPMRAFGRRLSQTFERSK